MKKFSFASTKDIDVIAVGRIAIDLNPNEIHRTLDKVNTFTKYVGGSPANIAVGLARLGKKVGFIGKVSDDAFGRYVTDYFIEKGIDVSHVSKASHGEVLGLTFTEISSPTESQILMYREGVADLQLAPEDVSEEYIKRARFLLISGTALAASPSREACFLAMKYAKKHDTRVIFDIDYRNYTWKSKAEVAVYYSLTGQRSDILMGSREEFELMEKLEQGNDIPDYCLADQYLSHGNQIVIIKHGKKGSLAYSSDRKAYQVGSFSVKLLKSFGGGDAYASAFLYGILEGWQLAPSLEFAAASAARVVSSHSCSDAMSTAEEIKSFIANSQEAGTIAQEIPWDQSITGGKSCR
ncbi:5-dehydro-2-deoxygluconokinase [Pelosinus sp. IPA-1]|uniref:5-dehydro-2-deoxygluconokinase n=1 Tax=Pelosinus sp. IPA-1 TaxID=3029569 RepID=UPI0024362A58|nr:5-dehydro-2-deoxygluconokinase [Pelosinus sp. IPA-1]GMA99990.1 5-dehydro-2-deoxygluconokinase [Pelosinus sp. IPA-1]